MGTWTWHLRMRRGLVGDWSAGGRDAAQVEHDRLGGVSHQTFIHPLVLSDRVGGSGRGRAVER
jgi:hypothetical protein